MDLKEAILHAQDISLSNDTCEECKEQHKQLAYWLRTLEEVNKVIGVKIFDWNTECYKTITLEEYAKRDFMWDFVCYTFNDKELR